MGDFTAWRFLIFAAFFAAVVYAHFYLAHRQWKRIKGEQATDIDVTYVRSETYFPQSFRAKVRKWISDAGAERNGGEVVIHKGQEDIRLAETLELPGETSCDEILVLERDFRCGTACALRRELLVHGNCEIGSESQLQAVAVDGDLTLGEGVRVARWVDSGGELRLEASSRVASRVTSSRRVWLGLNSEVLSVHSPEVVTCGWEPRPPADPQPARAPLDIVFAPDAQQPPDVAAAGLSSERLFRLGGRTWMYNGDVQPAIPVRITQNLAVKGSCYLPAGSVIEADLRATGSIFVGPGCRVTGNLIAEAHVLLGSGCRFSGLVQAEKTMLVSQGSDGLNADSMVAAYAGERLNLESNVSIKGKFSSGGRVTVVDSLFAETWKRQRGVREDGFRLERI